MTTASFILAVSIPVMPLWAGDTPLVELIKDLKASTDTIGIQVLGSQLAECEPKAETELKLLFEVFKDTALAPYAQSAVSNVKDPALGPMLIKELQAMKAGLKDISNEELAKLPPEQESKLMMEAMNLAAVVHPLGKLKYTPAAPDLRMLLSYDEAYQGYIAWAASEALGRMGDEEAYQMLMADLEKRKAVTVSGYGTRAIWKIVEKMEVIDATFKSSQRKPDDPRDHEINELSQKLEGMGKRDPDVKETLRRLLTHPMGEVRDGVSSAMIYTLSRQDKTITLEMLRNKDELVRMRGISSLRLCGTWDPSFLPILIEMIEHDPHAGVRGAAVSELHYLCSAGVRRSDLAPAVPYLQKIMMLPSIAMQSRAFDALRCITGRFFPFKGMHAVDVRRMEREPEYLPEDTTRKFP